jgi:putative spermidine/putrescine transport system permease protein
METRGVKIFLAVAATLVMLFLYLPLVVIFLDALNPSKITSWPVTHFSTRWFRLAFHDPSARAALRVSIEVALGATAIALVLGSAAAFAVHRFRFFGRTGVSFLLVLPIALPGIVTGIALLSAMNAFDRRGSIITIILGHATFCIVVVFNNTIARLRQSGASLEDASMDLGADGWQTFRYITLPSIATALVAGGLLAFALSFDEIIVTYFTAGSVQTLPLWIFNQFQLPNTQPEVNAVAVFVIVLTVIPVLIAQRLMRGSGGAVRNTGTAGH